MQNLNFKNLIKFKFPNLKSIKIIIFKLKILKLKKKNLVLNDEDEHMSLDDNNIIPARQQVPLVINNDTIFDVQDILPQFNFQNGAETFESDSDSSCIFSLINYNDLCNLQNIVNLAVYFFNNNY